METTGIVIECVVLYFLEGRTGNDTCASSKFRVKSDLKEKLGNLKKAIMSVDGVEKRIICNRRSSKRLYHLPIISKFRYQSISI